MHVIINFVAPRMLVFRFYEWHENFNNYLVESQLHLLFLLFKTKNGAPLVDFFKGVKKISEGCLLERLNTSTDFLKICTAENLGCFYKVLTLILTLNLSTTLTLTVALTRLS